MHLDVFKGDAFSLVSLTKAINDLPYVPGRLGQLKLFSESGIATTSVSIERMGATLALVPNKPRGAPGTVVVPEKRKAFSINASHLPQLGSVYADEVQNLRAFGTESDTDTVMNLVNRELRTMRRNTDITLEYQRMGALKGQVLDADGSSVLIDLGTLFGLTPGTHDMVLDSDTTKVRNKVVEFKRKIEDALGALPYTGVRVLCSSTFFDAFVAHPAVEESYRRWNESIILRSDMRSGFSFGDVIWEEYRGTVGGNKFIADNHALAIPEGVPDMFITHFAPANYMETVNTVGLPYYSKMKALDYDKGVEFESQSNPLMVNTRPNAVIDLTI